MNVQTSRVRRGKKIYEYCRQVKAYRRKDGKPALKVLGKLLESVHTRVVGQRHRVGLVV